MKRGKLIVFEGIDGSGKTTICKLLINYLKDAKISFLHYSFPRYDKPWGKLVRRYLSGEFGDVGAVDPYLASVLYAGDRLDAAAKINDDLDAGKIVVCDRYIASNIAHQAAKLITHHSHQRRGSLASSSTRRSWPKAASLITFINWIEDFEYIRNKIPKEDLVIYFSIPVEVSQKLMIKKKKDIHERNKKYLENVWQIFEDLAKSKKYWEKINCVENGRLLMPGEVFGKVLNTLNRRKIL